MSNYNEDGPSTSTHPIIQSKLANKMKTNSEISEGLKTKLAKERPHASNSRFEESSSEISSFSRYGASSILGITIPVSICMLVVIATISTLPYYTDQSANEYFVYTPFHSEDPNTSTLILETLGNTLIMIIAIAVMTFLLFFLYKMRCYKFIKGYMIFVTSILLSLYGLLYLNQVFQNYNITVDWITILFALWNFNVAGQMALHWKGPLLLQQTVLVIISVLFSLLFIKLLPEWTAWVILGVASIYDLYAVLTPHGPLNMLIELAQERSEDLFAALTYTAGMLWISGVNMDDTSAPVPTISDQVEDPPRKKPFVSETAEEEESLQKEKSGLKLGLGDFIFYSLLVGKAAATGDWFVTIACFVSIVVGLAVTLILLGVLRRPLPALPVSVALGLIFYFTSIHAIRPFMDELLIRQVFL